MEIRFKQIDPKHAPNYHGPVADQSDNHVAVLPGGRLQKERQYTPEQLSVSLLNPQNIRLCFSENEETPESGASDGKFPEDLAAQSKVGNFLQVNGFQPF